MKGDFSRDSFDPMRHFSRVLMQQGRLQLDADWNEQSAIVLHYLRALTRDVIGDHGGPGAGFAVNETSPSAMDFLILRGRYYVDGVLCENETSLAYTEQPRPLALESNKSHLVYLDVWERHVTALDVDVVREVALNGADTATRAQVVWRVGVALEGPNGDPIPTAPGTNWEDWLHTTGWPNSWVSLWQPRSRGLLSARAKREPGAASEPCSVSPESRYRGLENQLYRVEVHSGGKAPQATFKWSRDNGSVVFPVRSIAGHTIMLGSWDRRDYAGLEVGDWVELLDDDTVLSGGSGPLAQVANVDPDELAVGLSVPGGVTLPTFDADGCLEKHVQLRRWDFRSGTANPAGDEPEPADDGGLLIEEDKWLTLEDGVQVQFAKPAPGDEYRYRTGDYWLIPARTATGDVQWPGPTEAPEPRSPRGVHHHYAPLAIVHAGSAVDWVADLRRVIGAGSP